MFCATCLREKTGSKAARKRDWFVLSIVAQAVFGLLGLWFTTYFLGRALLQMPASFHEGTLWENLMP